MRIKELLSACIILNMQLARIVLTDMPLCAGMTGQIRDLAAASAVRRIPRRTVQQEQVDLSFRIFLGAAFPAGSRAVQSQIQRALLFNMHRAFKLCRLVARDDRRIRISFIAARIDIDLRLSDKMHQPMPVFFILFDLELAAANAQDIAVRLLPFPPLRTDLDAALELGIVDIDGFDIDLVLAVIQMYAECMRLFLVHPSVFQTIMGNSARLYLERSPDIKLCRTRCPDAAHWLLAAMQLLDRDIRPDVRLGSISFGVDVDAAHFSAAFPWFIDRSDDTDVENPPAVRRVLIAEESQSPLLPKIDAGRFGSRIRQAFHLQIEIMPGQIHLFLLVHNDGGAIVSVCLDRRVFRQRLIRIPDRSCFRCPRGHLP